MSKQPFKQGMGWLEWTLITILVILILVTLFMLLRPAITNFWQDFIQSLQ